MPNNNQLQEHRGQKGGKGGLPWDDIPEVGGVDSGVRLHDGFVNGVVGELRANN